MEMNKSKFFLIPISLFFLSSCVVNHAKVNNDLKKYFDSSNVEGTFAFFNNQLGNIIVYNMKLDTTKLSPGNSFKIMNTLIGVQTGKIANQNTVIGSDSAGKNGVTLKEAFHNSNIPYFQELSRQIGEKDMKQWLDSVSYGNKNISGPIDSFWLNSQLKISPDEQLGLMSKLYFEKLPFQKYAQQIVESLMLQEDNTLYKYSYTSGGGIDEKGNSFSWTLGWIEENRHVYFFVTYVTAPGNSRDLTVSSENVSRSILKSMGFFKGEK